MSAFESPNDSPKIYENSKNSKINGVSIQDGGKLSKAIQDVWLKNAGGLTGSLSSLKRGMRGSHSSSKKDDERSLKQEDQLSHSESFTSNLDEVFDSPNANEIPEIFKVSHPYNIPTDSNPYIQRFNVNTPGKNPFLSGSSYKELKEKIMEITVIPSGGAPNTSKSNRLQTENEVPITPLRACKPRNNRVHTPSIKLHTPEPGKCISLAHSRPILMQQQHSESNSPKQIDSPMPMPRTNPNCGRFNSKAIDSNHQEVTPFRQTGDGEHSPSTSSHRTKKQHSALCRTETETGSLYQVEDSGAQDESRCSSEGTEAPGVSFDKSFNLVDTSPSSTEALTCLGNTPVDLGSVFAGSNTPKDEENSKGELADDLDVQQVKLLSVGYREHSFDVTPTPTVCSSYQGQLGSGHSAGAALSLSMARNSISSCETHRLDLYQPQDPQEVKKNNLKLKIAMGLIIFGGCMFISAIIALIIEDPLDIM